MVALREGRTDAGIVRYPAPNDPSLAILPLDHNTYVATSPLKHPLAARARLRPLPPMSYCPSRCNMFASPPLSGESGQTRLNPEQIHEDVVLHPLRIGVGLSPAHMLATNQMEMHMFNRKSVNVMALASLAAALATMGTTSFAAEHDSQWAKKHPRREQVNERLNNQNHRIANEVKEGDMTHAQAAKLHKEDRQIRKEERLMASQNGGHITRQEQKTLNRQENAVNKQIGK